MRKLLALALLVFSFSASAAETNTDSLRYVDATLPNISDMLFKKGILKTDDPAALEEYIRIHHCGIYEQYERDDFAWTRIRESQARELQVKMPSMPEGLDVANVIVLDQYDLTNNQFMIVPENRLDNMGLITLWDEHTGSMAPCPGQQYNSFVPRVHPLSLTVKLDTPLTLAGVPMSRNAADALLDEMNKRTGSDTNKRKALMVLRIRVTGVDPLSVSTDPMRRTVLGQIDELRIYEGPARKNLLFKKNYESLRVSAGKK